MERKNPAEQKIEYADKKKEIQQKSETDFLKICKKQRRHLKKTLKKRTELQLKKRQEKKKKCKEIQKAKGKKPWQGLYRGKHRFRHGDFNLFNLLMRQNQLGPENHQEIQNDDDKQHR